jgi:hypothetical protein
MLFCVIVIIAPHNPFRFALDLEQTNIVIDNAGKIGCQLQANNCRTMPDRFRKLVRPYLRPAPISGGKDRNAMKALLVPVI